MVHPRVRVTAAERKNLISVIHRPYSKYDTTKDSWKFILILAVSVLFLAGTVTLQSFLSTTEYASWSQWVIPILSIVSGVLVSVWVRAVLKKIARNIRHDLTTKQELAMIQETELKDNNDPKL